jgi:hypothetical protein
MYKAQDKKKPAAKKGLISKPAAKKPAAKKPAAKKPVKKPVKKVEDWETYSVYQRAKFYDGAVELKRSNYKKLLGDRKWTKALFGQDWHDGKPLKKHIKKLRLVETEDGDAIQFSDLKKYPIKIDILDQELRGHPLVTGGGADPIYVIL